MDGLSVAVQARVELHELTLDPAYPFRVQAAAGLPEKRRATIRQALLAAGWGELDDAGREPLVRAVLARLDARAFDALLDASFAARCAQEPDALKRWASEPWTRWRAVLDYEDEYRRAAEAAKRAAAPASQRTLDGGAVLRLTEEQKVLEMLRRAGKAGLSNGALGGGATGRRYSARIGKLREKGYQIDTVKEGVRAFRFILRSEVV